MMRNHGKTVFKRLVPTWFRRVMGTVVFTALILVVFCNIWVVQETEPQVYDSLQAIPANNVGIILGTSRRLSTTHLNPYFDNRILAAIDLYKSGKIKHILVSGDNQYRSYNEPIEMKKALNALGLPDSVMTLDYAGFRTLDSIARSKLVFGQNKITVISQKFHNYRAIFICNFYGIDAVAYCAQDVTADQSSGVFKVYAREILARVRAVLDLYFINTQPKFLGEPIEIEVDGAG